MLGGNALLVESVEAVNLIIVAAHAESRTAAKAIHEMAFLFSLV
jgi:hypothetical protein